jgi:hypothetical protein
MPTTPLIAYANVGKTFVASARLSPTGFCISRPKGVLT